MIIKALKAKMVQTLNKPFDVMELLRKEPPYDTTADEGAVICNLSDIINKHATWKQHLPRVKPFYGKCSCQFSATKAEDK